MVLLVDTDQAWIIMKDVNKLDRDQRSVIKMIRGVENDLWGKVEIMELV